MSYIWIKFKLYLLAPQANWQNSTSLARPLIKCKPYWGNHRSHYCKARAKHGIGQEHSAYKNMDSSRISHTFDITSTVCKGLLSTRDWIQVYYMQGSVKCLVILRVRHSPYFTSRAGLSYELKAAWAGG